MYFLVGTGLPVVHDVGCAAEICGNALECCNKAKWLPGDLFVLPTRCQALMMWSLQCTERILQSPDASSWNSRWLEVLEEADRNGSLQTISQTIVSTGRVQHGYIVYSL